MEMQSKNKRSPNPEIVTVEWSDRWQIYHRLQTLDIPCQCRTNKPLQVKLDGTLAAIQLWSVTKQFTASRQELVHWLNQCWMIKS